jgi:uncharacterized protein
MRIVLDTNILVRATKTAAGPAREILRCFRSEEHVLVLSRFILTELLRVLNYERVFALHGLTSAEQQEFVAALDQLAEIVDLPEPRAAVSQDPDDDPVIATAIVGHADVLCTLDRHLLHPNVQSHCETNGVRVMSDAALLNLLREPPGEEESA